MDSLRSSRRWMVRPLLNKLPVSLLVCLGFAVPAGRADHGAAPLTLDDCVQIGLERQPSLAAARASLAASQTQQQALDRMLLAGLISRELPIRKQQAALGVTIAAAGLQQAEWETIYAVTRNYYSVLYAHKQEAVARGVVEKLKAARETAISLVKKGDPDSLVTQIDVDKLTVNIDLYTVKLIEARQGIELAAAALREAMGVGRDCPLVLYGADLPPLAEGIDRCQVVDLALARRGELVQAITAARVTELEVDAQGTSFLPTMRTFAAVSDIHARPIPQGVANREYRPGAIGLDMPTTLAGRRGDRMERARDLSNRAVSVVDKTTNLITLEAEAAYLKWAEAAQKVTTLAQTPAKAIEVANSVQKRFEIGKVAGEDLIRARTLEDQAVAQYNEALYLHALALAALERVTAGGYSPAFRAARRPHP